MFLIFYFQALVYFILYHNFFPSGSVMLFLALSIQIILLTHAAPMDCQKNTAVCLEEIMKEMTQVRFELNILTENRTLIRRK